VPLTDLVVAFHKALAPGLGDSLQWHLAQAAIPRRHRVDCRIPGVKLLTWSSALGLEFDTVILAGLHYAGNGRSAAQLAATLQLLAASAQERLILSYSGPGEPTALDFLPRQFLEVRETLPFVAEMTPLIRSEPAHRTTGLISTAPTPRPVSPVQRSAAEIARLLLTDDRDRRSRRRVLSAEEEVGLAQLIRGPGVDLTAELPKGFRASMRPGDERGDAFDAMVTHNEGLVWSIVRTHSWTGMDDDDLYQNGIFGLMRAIEKFDASKGTKFSTYATWWIRQTIDRSIADEGAIIRLPVHVHEQVRKVARVRSQLRSQHGYASLAAIGRVVDMTPEKVAEFLRLGAGVISLDAPLHDDPDFSIADLISVDPDKVTDPGEIIDRQAGIEIARQALDRMDDRNAFVLRLRYGFDGQDEHTLDQIGTKLTLTRERIRQIEMKAKEELVYQLAVLGVRSRTAPDDKEPPSPPAPRPKARRAACPSTPRARPARSSARPPASPTTAARPAPSPRQRLTDRPEQADSPIERLGTDLTAGTRENLPGPAVAPAPSLGAWLPELVDQGLSSHATRITIERSQVGSLSWLAFIHDGDPSAQAVLCGCLLHGLADDTVIAGLWPAFQSALGLFRELMVWHLGTAGDLQQPMVLASPGPDGAWSLFESAGVPTPAVCEAAAAGPSSVVVFRRPWLDYGVADLQSVLRTLRADLGLTLGDLLLSGRVTLTIDGQRVTPRDPFLSRNPAAQDLGIEQVTAGGHSALVNPRVLPHPASLASDDTGNAGNPADWERTQGFYVRCEQRYLSCAGWLGLPGLEATAATSLARVAVEIQPDERDAWGLRKRGQAVMPPEPLRPRLAVLATLARKRSEQVLAR
jgi:RNA polymerase sigma factor (sigma-70 family)